MLPLNYAIFKIFESETKDLCAKDVMNRLRPQYQSFRAFKETFIAEVLMCGEVNGVLRETRFEQDKNDKLHIYYTADEGGKKVIGRYIPDITKG